MDVKVLAICDTEKQYAKRLMEAFCEKKTPGFQIHAFSKTEELEHFASQNQIELLLISGRNMSERIGQCNIGKIILLSDGEVYEAFSDYESIYKYQSAEQIMKEVLCYCAEYVRPVTTMCYGQKSFVVYGVYSPIGRCGKSILAKLLAEHFGKTRKVLLLDLQSFCAKDGQLSAQEQWDLADMIYFLRQGKKTFFYKLGSIVKNENAFDYILPMKTPADLRSVTLSEWTELLEKLASDSDYQVVVIDFGNDVCELFKLLSQCTGIYMPVLSDDASRKKVENFEWVIRSENFEEIMEGLHKLYIPGNLDERSIRSFLEDWIERNVVL